MGSVHANTNVIVTPRAKGTQNSHIVKLMFSGSNPNKVIRKIEDGKREI